MKIQTFGTKVLHKLAATHFSNLFSNYFHCQPSYLDSSICFLPFKHVFHFQVMLVAVIDKPKCQWLNTREVSGLLTYNPKRVFLFGRWFSSKWWLRDLGSFHLMVPPALTYSFRVTPKVERTLRITHEKLLWARPGDGTYQSWVTKQHLAEPRGVSSKKRTQVWWTANYSVLATTPDTQLEYISQNIFPGYILQRPAQGSLHSRSPFGTI